MRKKTHEEYESQLFEREIDYFPLENYQGNHTPILYQGLCGHSWKITPGHVLAGVGCPTCAGNKLKTGAEYKAQISFRPFINLDPYVRDYIPLAHQCSKCFHIWRAAPSYILQGTGCPVCNTGSFDPTKPSRVYHVSINTGTRYLYKIGITNNSVRERFKRDWSYFDMHLLWEIEFEKGSDAFKLEQKLKREHTFLKNVHILKGGGNTELLAYEIEKPQ